MMILELRLNVLLIFPKKYDVHVQNCIKKKEIHFYIFQMKKNLEYQTRSQSSQTLSQFIFCQYLRKTLPQKMSSLCLEKDKNYICILETYKNAIIYIKENNNNNCLYTHNIYIKLIIIIKNYI